jgi:hypothetical protein
VTRARLHPLTAAVAVLGLLLSGCGAAHVDRRPSRRSAPASASSPAAGITPQSAASTFAGAYVRLIDGAGEAAQLPDATTRARREAARGGVISPARRRGTLILEQVAAAHGVTGQFLITAREPGHTVYAQETVARIEGRWVVSGLVTPDFAQVFVGENERAPRSPRGSAAPRAAAQMFLADYLPWYYGHGRAAVIRDVSAALRRQLQTHPVIVPPSIARLHGRAAAVGMRRHGSGWLALVDVTDGRETYQLNLSLTGAGEHWRVTAVRIG